MQILSVKKKCDKYLAEAELPGFTITTFIAKAKRVVSISSFCVSGTYKLLNSNKIRRWLGSIFLLRFREQWGISLDLDVN